MQSLLKALLALGLPVLVCEETLTDSWIYNLQTDTVCLSISIIVKKNVYNFVSIHIHILLNVYVSTNTCMEKCMCMNLLCIFKYENENATVQVTCNVCMHVCMYCIVLYRIMLPCNILYCILLYCDVM